MTKKMENLMSKAALEEQAQKMALDARFNSHKEVAEWSCNEKRYVDLRFYDVNLKTLKNELVKSVACRVRRLDKKRGAALVYANDMSKSYPWGFWVFYEQLWMNDREYSRWQTDRRRAERKKAGLKSSK